MLKKMLKHEGTTFDESNGNATNIQQMCMVCGAENFTLPQALAVAVRIREICHNIKIDESSEKSATVADGIAKITMSSIVRHLDCGNIISWECCIQFKKIDTVGGDGGHFDAAAVQVCQRFIDNILI
jgi:hypothetical protein